MRGIARRRATAPGLRARALHPGYEMARVEIRPTVAADLPHLTAAPLPWRIKAMTGLVDGEIVGVAGIGFPLNGAIVAFAQLTPAARAHKFALHRAALRFLDECAREGIAEIVALPDVAVPGAESWLRHLGFTPLARNGQQVWVWHNA